MRWYRLREYLASSLWFVPILCVLGGAALSFATIALDRLLGDSFLPRSVSGDPDAALAILTTVAASMVTLTGLVLTITMVVVQLAMGQFTPRVLRTILRDRPSQLAIGIFVATFAHAMLVMREVRAVSTEEPEGYVPGIAIVVAFVLILISIMVLVSYVHHIGRSLTVASLIDAVGNDTRKLLDELFPPDAREGDREGYRAESIELPHRPDRLVVAPEPGVVVAVKPAELVELAGKHDVVLRMLPQMGDFVPQGATLFELYGEAGDLQDADLVGSVALANERTLNQDLAYGIRLLVDVGVRSVSEAMGDPTTTTQTIDRLHDLLRQLVQRPFPSGRHADAAGAVRLVMPTLSWEGYVRLAFDELREYGSGSIQVSRRLQAMLCDLIEVAPEERREPLEEQLRLLEAAASSQFESDRDAQAATVPDQQGIGSGADVSDGDGDGDYAAAKAPSFSRK